MSKFALAFAQDAGFAYRRSGTHAEGPAGLLISTTGEPVVSRLRRPIDTAYACSPINAGAPANLLISTIGGAVIRGPAPSRDPACAYSGTLSRRLLTSPTGR